MFYIDSVDLIGNAFAIYVDKTSKRTLSLAALENYGNAIVKELKKFNLNYHLLFEKEDINFFLEKHSNWFSYKENDNTIVLNTNISADNLYNTFAVDLSIEELLSFSNTYNSLLLH